MAYPKFGVAGTCEAETLSYRSDQLEYQDGFETSVFPLKFTDTIRRSKPSLVAQTYGIGKSDDPTRNSLGVPLETVTKTEEEEVTTPHMVATNPGVAPNLGDKLTYTDGLIFIRKKITIRISGKGDPPAAFGVNKRGQTFEGTITIKPAVGDTPSVEETGGMYISSVELTKSVTDWQKFTIELVKYVGNTVDKAQENMITPILWTKEELDAISAWRKITRTSTLNFNGPADIEETVELYDDSPSETFTTTTTTTTTAP